MCFQCYNIISFLICEIFVINLPQCCTLARTLGNGHNHQSQLHKFADMLDKHFDKPAMSTDLTAEANPQIKFNNTAQVKKIKFLHQCTLTEVNAGTQTALIAYRYPADPASCLYFL